MQTHMQRLNVGWWLDPRFHTNGYVQRRQGGNAGLSAQRAGPMPAHSSGGAASRLGLSATPHRRSLGAAYKACPLGPEYAE